MLSACNSARYEPSIIDSGIQGLATSFAIAGVPSMIAALWPIESTITRTLIIDTFLAARGSKVGIADALAMAVRRHLDGPAPRPLLHPRFWAALVVVGDGSMTLDAAAGNSPRDLGPFAAVTPSEDQEILSGAPLDGDFATSTIGAWNGTRSPSLIRRQTPDGTTEWQIKDSEIGAGLTAAATQTIYAGGYRSLRQGAASTSVPVLRGLGADGKVLWSHRLPSGPQGAMILGLATADQSALALVGPHKRRKHRSRAFADPYRRRRIGSGAVARPAGRRRARRSSPAISPSTRKQASPPSIAAHARRKAREATTASACPNSASKATGPTSS